MQRRNVQRRLNDAAQSGLVQTVYGRVNRREAFRQTAALINSSDYAKKYTAGCLSFEESNIPAEQKHALMDSFEEC
ncbi:hypothetical protein, partial [Neisseria gonorrhoeae]|uniref:hypothetical protein n=1 Tax=Neisseria gonorrhoeae TaxID=485 RepID=UPI0035A330FE